MWWKQKLAFNFSEWIKWKYSKFLVFSETSKTSLVLKQMTFFPESVSLVKSYNYIISIESWVFKLIQSLIFLFLTYFKLKSQWENISLFKMLMLLEVNLNSAVMPEVRTFTGKCFSSLPHWAGSPCIFLFQRSLLTFIWIFPHEVYCICLDAVNFLCSSPYGAGVCIFDQAVLITNQW